MKWISFLSFLFLLHSANAGAAVTVRNFTNTSQGYVPVVKVAEGGKALALHDGKVKQWTPDGPLYRYGSMYGCGFVLRPIASKSCGFGVSVSRDGGNSWSEMQPLFTPTDTFKNNWCYLGCFRVDVEYNDASGKWIGVYNTSFFNTGVRVIVADAPEGPFQDVGWLTPSAGAMANDIALWKDPITKEGYIFYSYVGPDGHNAGIRAEKLNASFTETSGMPATTIIQGQYEAASPFDYNGKLYVVFGAECGFCNATPTLFSVATNGPLSAWSAATQISGDSCGGQPSGVSKITFAGVSKPMYQSDLWISAQRPPGNTGFGYGNQARAQQFWTWLTIGSNGSINPINCDATITFDAPNPVPVPLFAGIDQAPDLSAMSPWCAENTPNNNVIWSQNFKPTIPGMHTVKFLAFAGPGQTANKCSIGTCEGPNGDLILEVYATNQVTHQPSGSPVASKTISNLSWDPTIIDGPSYTVALGLEYAIVMRSTITNSGCFGFAYNDSGWSGGKAFVSFNGGGTWFEQAGRVNYFLDVVTTPASSPTPPSITTASLVNGTASVSLGAITLSSSGGTAPYAWSVIGGALPPGVTLSSNGIISGTPTFAGSYNFTVQVRDGLGQTASKAYTITINPAPSSGVIPIDIQVTCPTGFVCQITVH